MTAKLTAVLLASLGVGAFFFARPAVSQQKQQSPPVGTKVEPKLVPVAETRLLMEGLAHSNFRGLERILKQKPADDKAWTFARGQALLIAETGNLLMLRPPKNAGEAIWFGAPWSCAAPPRNWRRPL